MEEDQPKQRRARTPNPAFSTPDQPIPPAKPAKSPPPVTFRPPSVEPSSGTGTNSPEATPPPRPQGTPRKSTPRKAAPPRPAANPDPAPAPPAKATPRRQPAAKATPAPKDEAATPTPPAKRQPRKIAPSKAAPPAKATLPAKAAPAKATPPAKAATPVKAAAPPVKAAPPLKAVAAELAPAIVTPDLSTVPDVTPAAPAVDTPRRPETLLRRRTDAWARIVADPGHSPELLALAAVQIIGPRAEGWARRTRDAYPAATPDALARLAVSQFTRAGSASSVFAAVAGSYAPLALLGAAALTHAELALHVAAAYGLDPADRARAADLLVLTRVHPDAADAEAAIAAALEDGERDPGLDAAWRLGRMVVAQAGGWAALRVVNRFFPGTSLLAATLTSRGAVRALSARAIQHYRRQSQPPASEKAS